MAETDDPTLRDTEVDSETQAEGPVGHRRRRERLARGARLGRYVVEDPVGAGGMGVVYAAYDPELHRRVALKLLQPSLGRSGNASAGRARLLREAQAMARLSHPNVIHVYDVGTFEEHVFLALEFIDGENLARWLKRTNPSWRDVVRVFLAAGRGLAAAHAAGLVHRDFKPDNVLIAKDGRVLVTDFGLARAEGDLDIELPTAPGSGRGSQPPSLLDPLTVAGTVMGTPGYAAPEHLRGATGDARSDQFSFAASLYAALYRKRPYPADSFDAYRKLLKDGVPPPPSTTDVPAWVRRVVERGLAQDPAARYPSMDALLAALADDPAIRRRKWLVIGGVAIAVGVAAGATIRVVRTRSNDALLCKGADRKLAGVWDDAKRAAVKRAFLATDRPYKQQALAGATKRLDDRARAWAAMSAEACEATRRRGEQTEAILTLRQACLDERLRELANLVELFVAADGKVVERAISATSNLSPLEVCADVKTLLAAVAPPSNPAIRAQVDAQRQQLGRSKALFDAGKFKEAAELAEQVVAASKTIDYRPLEAEALYRLGETRVYLQAGQPAVDALREAARAAEATRYDSIRARSLAWMVGVIGGELEKPQEGLALAEDARATLERIGRDPYVESILESSLGRTYSSLGDYAQMLEHHKRALELRKKLFGEDDPNTAAAYNNVAIALKKLSRYDEALVAYEKAQQIKVKILGADHPDTAMGLVNIGSFFDEMGNVDAALRAADAGVASAKKSLPAKHGTILVGLANKGSLLGDLGRYDEAQATYDELLKTLNAEFPNSARLGRTLAAHAAYVLAPTGRAKEALAQAKQAEQMELHVVGKPNDDVAFAIYAQGRAYEVMRDYPAALAAYEKSIAIDEQVLGHDEPSIREALLGIARIHLARGKPADAVPPLERAIAILERHKIRGVWLARVRLALARALLGSDPARANDLATQAHIGFGTAVTKEERAELEAVIHTAARR